MRSIYTLEPDYKMALKNTDEDLSPFAAIMHTLEDEFNFPPGFPIHPHSKRIVLLTMTTVFNDPTDNEQWGWFWLPSDAKEGIGELLLDNKLSDSWTYWSQVKESLCES